MLLPPRLLSPLFVLLALTIPTVPLGAADAPKPEPLWPDGAPGATGTNPADVPTLTAYLPDPDKATGAAIVVCPGGGYGTLAITYIGFTLAQLLG